MKNKNARVAVPFVRIAPGYYNTVEGCLTHRLGREADQAVKEVFNGLHYGLQRWLESTPEKSRDWVGRALFWRRKLRPVLPPETYHKVMALFIGWYIRCLRMMKEQEAPVNAK